MEILNKLKILTDAAKYDVCASSACSQSNWGSKGFGNMSRMGVCHSFTPDGRCISLFKVLLTNQCINDCLYCINRKSNDRLKTCFGERELADLFIQFYKRNYVEGLFLTSGIYKNSEETMERMIKVIEILRFEYQFRGYIHLKVLPGVSPGLINKGAVLANRMSINLECPTTNKLELICPEKDFKHDLIAPMLSMKKIIKNDKTKIPAGQTTQMIIGASGENDREIITTSAWLYQKVNLCRIYYSAFIPVNQASNLPVKEPVSLKRESRLYQADWLMRRYGFAFQELPFDQTGNLPLDFDPKMAWAILNLDKFPIEINKASYRALLRIPGIGEISARRIIKLRKDFHITSLEELKNIGVVLKRAVNFILIKGKYFGQASFNNKILPILGENSLLPNQNQEQLAFAL
ncbi:MAG: putative DNA modification/repair radical SAM protein [Candidatus Buchananbacteria bacterium]|nr:putative DNA modification/repair radical SAM protein [Candidatus Buchananbacteria bacterium]